MSPGTLALVIALTAAAVSIWYVVIVTRIRRLQKAEDARRAGRLGSRWRA